MIKKIRLLAPVLIFIAAIGVLLLLIGHFIKENKIDLYDVDFKKFDFKKNQTYDYEVEIIGDYFYKKRYNGKRQGTYFYYNAKLKNKYDDNIYVVYEINNGARINMDKSGNRTFARSGVIKNISKEMEKSYQNSLSNINTTGQTYDLYFVFSAKSNIEMFGTLFLIFPVFMIVFVLPLSCLVDKKFKFKKEA